MIVVLKGGLQQPTQLKSNKILKSKGQRKELLNHLKYLLLLEMDGSIPTGKRNE